MYVLGTVCGQHKHHIRIQRLVLSVMCVYDKMVRSKKVTCCFESDHREKRDRKTFKRYRNVSFAGEKF